MHNISPTIVLVTGNLVTPMKNYMELRNSLITNYIAQ